jgi:ribosomal protein L32
MTTAAQTREQQHHCLPRAALPCPACGERLAAPEFCEICGEDTTPRHICVPRPLPHLCATLPTRGACLACGQALPEALFCTTCGADITPSHRCPAAPPTTVPRPDPLHRCPALELEYCAHCGGLLPAMTFCARCGMEITAGHTCPPRVETHACPPLAKMPRRCSKCGELLPAHQHCMQCGTDITAEHICSAAS